MISYTPYEVAVALSLYAYNVAPAERAQRIYNHFDGYCAELNDLVKILHNDAAYAATELAPPSAIVYINHALETYGEEARKRCMINT